MMRFSVIPLLFGALLGAAAVAAAPRPEDFAFGFPIETEGEAALWRFELPEAVYRHVTRADLGDLRVFDGAGNVVPHTLGRPALLDAEPPAAVKLSFFPIYGTDDGGDAGRSMRIVTNEQGSIVDVIGGAPLAAKSARLKSYLIDTSPLERIPSALSLSWKGGSEAGFAVTLRLDSADELTAWRPLVPRASLADLSFGDARLIHREIALPPRRAKYLRIIWPVELREVRLTAIQARFPALRQPPPRHWLTLSDGEMTQEPTALEFNSNGHWPVDRLRLALPTRNAVLRGTLESRNRPEAHWHRRFQGLFYRLEHNGAVLASEPVKIAPTADPHWRLRPAAKEGWPNGPRPALELGWVPHELTFLAQGQPPYTLAFGSATVEAPAQPVDALLKQIDRERQSALIRPARLGQQTPLGGEQRLQPPPPPLPWKQWLLWTVLVLGVGLLGWMVRRLMRQMGEGR